jgi:hypothetical protein
MALKRGTPEPYIAGPDLTPDLVNSPPHYQSPTGLEVVDVIEAFGLGWHLGNCVKYILRAGHKGDALTDLKKARWMLDRHIENLGHPK